MPSSKPDFAPDTARPGERLVVRGAREHNLRTSTSCCLASGSWSSPGSPAPVSRRSPSTRSTPRASADTSSRSRRTPGSSWGSWRSPTSTRSRGSPAISIEQKTVSRNPRSTVGTVTEIYDYLRLLWARAGTPHCPELRRAGHSPVGDADRRSAPGLPEGTRVEVLAPLVRGRKGEFRDLFEKARKDGFVRVRVDGETYDLTEPPKLNRYENHDIAVVVDRLVLRDGTGTASRTPWRRRSARAGASWRCSSTETSCPSPVRTSSASTTPARTAAPTSRSSSRGSSPSTRRTARARSAGGSAPARR
jgi:excinuclease ABC subunit A